MPKRSKRPAVSAQATEAFSKLHEQIEAAEKLMRKLPGARTDDTKVWLNKLFPVEHPSDSGTSLEFYGEPGEFRVCNYFFDGSTGEEVCSSKRLSDYPIVTRIRIAEHIPELIQLAKAAEGKVADLANDTAASIEQAISEQLDR